MKHNTEKLKNTLEQALKSVPSDFALFDVRHHIRIAINKINEIENKREKKGKIEKSQKQRLKLKAQSIYIIDQMIEEEGNKLKEIENKTL